MLQYQNLETNVKIVLLSQKFDFRFCSIFVKFFKKSK